MPAGQDGAVPFTAPVPLGHYRAYLLGAEVDGQSVPVAQASSPQIQVVPCPVGMVCTPPADGSDERFYYDTDAIGSVRQITNDAGAVVARYDYTPFGEEVVTPPVQDPRRFAGKEWDAESHLNYFGTRYFAANLGRFASVDPLSADLLRAVDPQRWNRYTYGLNNPLRYEDPDGRDVLVVNFPFGAFGVGHVGIAAVDPRTGRVKYGGFNPVTPGSPLDVGQVVPVALSLTIGANGRPTAESLAVLKAVLAKAEGQSSAGVNVAYIRTSDTATQALSDYIELRRSKPGVYCLLGSNCQDFVQGALGAAGINIYEGAGLVNMLPNVFFLRYVVPIAYHDLLPRANVTTHETLCASGTTECWSQP